MGRVVLVLDHDNDPRWSYKTELEKEGYDVFITTDPKLALRYIQMYGVDFIVLDVASLDSGLDCLYHIVGFMKPKIVIHSNYPEVSYNFHPPDDFVPKSSDLSNLRRSLNHLNYHEDVWS